MQPAFDEKIGEYDADEAYCPNHPGEQALYEQVEGMGIDPALAELLGDGGAWMQTVWVCGICADV